jgi:hypothetical protein
MSVFGGVALLRTAREEASAAPRSAEVSGGMRGTSLLVQNQFTDRHEAGGVRGKKFLEFLAAGASRLIGYGYSIKIWFA